MSLRFTRLFSFTVPILLLMCAQFTLQIRLRALDSVYVEEPDQASPWDPSLFRAISFGHLPSALDWLWISTLTDPAISQVMKGTHPKMYYDLDLATEIDPAFLQLYYAGANLLAVVRNDGSGARNLLLKGNAFRKAGLLSYPKKFQEERWGYGWVLPVLLAYVYLFELDDIRSAGQAFREAAELKGSPQYLQNLHRRFDKPGGEYEVGMRLTQFLIRGASDLRVKEKLETRYLFLSIGQFLFQINLEFTKFKEAEAKRKKKTPNDFQSLWVRFRESVGRAETDSWGGKLSVDPKGKIVTSTPYGRVFGLE